MKYQKRSLITCACMMVFIMVVLSDPLPAQAVSLPGTGASNRIETAYMQMTPPFEDHYFGIKLVDAPTNTPGLLFVDEFPGNPGVLFGYPFYTPSPIAWVDFATDENGEWRLTTKIPGSGALLGYPLSMQAILQFNGGPLKGKYELSDAARVDVMKTFHADVHNVGMLLDSTAFDYRRSYAPSIIYDGGSYHMFFSSSSSGGNWDYVRYTSAKDGRIWEKPTVVLTPCNNQYNVTTGHPSIVKYQAPGDPHPYYYLFYTGAEQVTGSVYASVMFVARATNIEGPYLKYTNRNTWEFNPYDPKKIINPENTPYTQGYFGAGRQTVVVKDGELHGWWHDDTTLLYSHGKRDRILHTKTNNPVDWPQGIPVDATYGTMTNPTLAPLEADSVDIKFDPTTNHFIMIEIGCPHTNLAELVRRYSLDGVTWSAPLTLSTEHNFPDFAHDPGISGDPIGNMIDGRGLILYGVPKFSGSQPTENLDLFGTALNPAKPVWNGIPYGWQMPNLPWGSDYTVAVGDWDGDGLADPGLVDCPHGLWYLCTSQGTSYVPWGWPWYGMGSQHEVIVGDFDGDKISDRCICERATGTWWVLTSTGSGGFPWSWYWLGMSENQELCCGDYDGDGITDRSIFEKEIGVWFVILSTTNVMESEHIPAMTPNAVYVPGDFEGDNKDDFAFVDLLVSPSQWYVRLSSGGHWDKIWPGLTIDFKPVCADYDGDGRTNFAICRPSHRLWWIYDATGIVPHPEYWSWEMPCIKANFVPAPADYDGDGKDDIGAFDPVTHRWYVVPLAGFNVYW